MKTLIIPIISLSLLITSCNSSSSASVERPKTPEELKIELLEQEKTSPTTYLSIDSKMREDQVKVRDAGLFRDAEYAPDGNTIYGTIKNTATIATFKDVVVTVTFYSQTDTPIETKDFVIYEFYKPNSTNQFELKVYPPETMAKFGIDIKNATPVN